ncbi:MAG: hypothetical protein C0601_13435 [Candidatus Muiribacterium halophilum]|uniref:Cell division protein SepF n=1 Tax=Muiribacterium halophilum TaxID=2053465 RepID=A0A2N5Z9F8_MUIH1|nr:MAG: hypothetical protein C0601_13435 [Candidatus Muirbacterium halophilum]
MAEKSLWRKFLGLIGIEEYEEEYLEQDYENPKVVNLANRNGNDIVLVSVESFEYAKRVTSLLRARKAIVLNLKNVIREEAKRIIDFICGTTFALNGNMQKIGEEIFLFTPYTMNIIEDKKKEESNVMQDAKEA